MNKVVIDIKTFEFIHNLSTHTFRHPFTTPSPSLHHPFTTLQFKKAEIDWRNQVLLPSSEKRTVRNKFNKNMRQFGVAQEI